MSVVVLDSVSKSFGGPNIVERFSARFGPGVHLLVGPNGSGKSTLLNLVAGALVPDCGSIAIDGLHGEAAKAMAFLAPPDAPAVPWITARQFVAFAAGLFAGFRGEARIEPLARALGFEAHLDAALGELSSGTARKALLAAAWLSGAPVLLLDEPTNELDARSVDAFVDLLAQEPQRTVIVATHLVAAFACLSPSVTPLDAARAARAA